MDLSQVFLNNPHDMISRGKPTESDANMFNPQSRVNISSHRGERHNVKQRDAQSPNTGSTENFSVVKSSNTLSVI